MSRSILFRLLLLTLGFIPFPLWADQAGNLVLIPGPGQLVTGLPVMGLMAGGKPVTAEVANTTAAREKGMMFRKSLVENDAMLFVFPESAPRAFWMKNSSLPLSIAFLDDKGKILNILDMVPLTEIRYESSGPAKYALEMNKGWFAKNGIKPGDSIPKVLEAPPDTESQDKPPYALTTEQLARGKSQLQQMLKDRPAMAAYVREGDDLWNWTVRQFAGEYIKDGVEWDPGSPKDDFDSTACGPNIPKNKKAYIQNTKNFAAKNFHPGEPKTAPALWYEMALEFCNLMNRSRFDQINAEARASRFGRTDYAFEYMAVEDITTNRNAHDFFYNHWVPNCQKLGLAPQDQRFSERFGTIGNGFTKEGFKQYFRWIGGKGVPKTMTDFEKFCLKDFDNHYKWYTSLYNKYAPETFTQKGLPIPPDVPSEEIENKFLDELIPPIPAVVLDMKAVQKEWDEIPPPP